MKLLKSILQFEQSFSRCQRLLMYAMLLMLMPGKVGAWVAGSGDVDLDGRTSVHDAVLILESNQWPEAERNRLHSWRDACNVDKNGACEEADALKIILSTITDWNDFDSDGVPNNQDCAILRTVNFSVLFFVKI